MGPIVSVNMVVYNGEKYISEAIQSILDQSYSNFELVIHDNGSTDNTLKKIDTFKDSRIKLIRNKINKGVVNARNITLRESSGEFIAILDSDDISTQNRLELQIGFLEKNKDYGLIGGLAELIDANGSHIDKIQSLSLSPEETKVILLFKNCFTHSSVMYRKNILDRFLFNTEVPTSEDYEVIVKIGSEMKVGSLNEAICKCRIHDKNTSNNQNLVNRNQKLIISNQLSLIGIFPSEKELNIHLQLRKNTFHSDLGIVIEKAQWLDKLYMGNSRAKYLPEAAFNKRIFGYWFNLMNNPIEYSWKLILHYFKSPIRKNSNHSIMDDFKFFLKCIINKKQIIHPHS